MVLRKYLEIRFFHTTLGRIPTKKRICWRWNPPNEGESSPFSFFGTFEQIRYVCTEIIVLSCILALLNIHVLNGLGIPALVGVYRMTGLSLGLRMERHTANSLALSWVWYRSTVHDQTEGIRNSLQYKYQHRPTRQLCITVHRCFNINWSWSYLIFLHLITASPVFPYALLGH